ncbi:PIN domain-containing protein [Lamprocystis purpurea]|uniref:hypothetical protein n=1 Tax=Lamprocystis purpurea TaxID=61598 RepID=UPI001B7F9DDE|nr:hypothetical protein [Lamprocystis purpurea]
MDTGAWFASFVPTDADHAVARAWLVRNQAPLLTTDYVIDELLTLMRMRGENRRALRVGQSLLDQGLAELHLVSPTTSVRLGVFIGSSLISSGASPTA